jgi:hypothetical protein
MHRKPNGCEVPLSASDACTGLIARNYSHLSCVGDFVFMICIRGGCDMKKILRIVGILAAILIVIIAGVVAYFFLYYPNVDKAPQLTVERTSERIERGRYLANQVSGCLGCHSTRNDDYFAGPIIKGTEGKGGERFGPEFGLPGVLYASNITPSGIGSLTDGELLRAITSGVRKDNSVLFPLMPYPHFTKMSDEDLYSIIAYIRTLKPIPNDIPKSSINFPVSMFIRAVPSTHVSVPQPDSISKADYGDYLVNAAGACSACHTQMDKGGPKKGMVFAGGNEFRIPAGIIRSANITPDEETGIGYWTEDLFVDRFKFYASASSQTLDPKKVGYYTVMPWTMYGGMSEDDLRAIYAYLRTLPPVHNAVTKYEPLK